MYSLKDILKQYFNKLCIDGRLKGDVGTDWETRFSNFYIDKVKCFRDITHLFNIEEEMELLKKLTSNNYAFSERNKDFIIMLFDEYTGKLDCIRRGVIYQAESDFIITVYEGFIDVFKDAGSDCDLLEAVSVKMFNRLDVPVRKLQSIRESSYTRLEKMINDKMNEYALGISIMERYQWLFGLEADLKAFITKWEDLFDIMNELRTEEINGIAEKVASNIGDDEFSEAKINFVYSEEISVAVNEDKEYQNLQRKRCQMIGREYEKPRQTPITIHDILAVNQKIMKRKKRPILKKVEKKIYETNEQLQARYDEIRTAVIRKHIPDYESSVEEVDTDFSSLISTEELMKNAIKELRKEWEWEKKRKNRTLVELPDIDFDELRKKMDYIP